MFHLLIIFTYLFLFSSLLDLLHYEMCARVVGDKYRKLELLNRFQRSFTRYSTE